MSLGSRTEIPAPGYSLTKGRKPKTGEAKLMVQYRCGYVDKWPYTSGQLRWDDTCLLYTSPSPRDA